MHHSADYLFKLYRATGERRYAELLRDIMHAHAEVMETPGRPTTGMGPGSSMERITLADGEGKGAIGQILHTSNGWTEDNGMLMALENPGIYVRTDKDELYVFDHVEARVIKRDKAGRDPGNNQPDPVRRQGHHPRRVRQTGHKAPRLHRLPQVAEGRDQGWKHPSIRY